MSDLSLVRLMFDPANAADGPSIGSYLVGAGGNVATTTTVGANEALDINIVQTVGDTANIEIKNTAATVTTTAAQVLASPLAARKTVTAYNNGSQTVYVGFDGTVTSTNGFPIFKGSAMTLDVGPAVSIYMIAGSGSQNVRFLEIS